MSIICGCFEEFSKNLFIILYLKLALFYLFLSPLNIFLFTS